MTRALVVFEHGSDQGPWAWCLKPGFRHIYLIVESAPVEGKSYWVQIDTDRWHVRFRVIRPATFDMAAYLASYGSTVIETEVRVFEPMFPLLPMIYGTCTGLVKRILGVRCAWLKTPWQLYRYLKRTGDETTDDSVAAHGPGDS